MERLVLKQDILNRIKDDPILFGKLANVLDVKVSYLLRLVIANSVKLTQASAVQLLKRELKLDEAELFTTQTAKAVA